MAPQLPGGNLPDVLNSTGSPTKQPTTERAQALTLKFLVTELFLLTTFVTLAKSEPL